MVRLRFLLNLRLIWIGLFVFALFNILDTALMAKSFVRDKGKTVTHVTGKQIKESDMNKCTVYVKVSPSDLVGVTIHISGEHYNDYKPGTDVTFYDVPEGDYSFRAVYGSMEASESGKYIGEDDTVYLRF